MPAFPSALSGFIFHPIEWPLDSCNLERDTPPFKEKKIAARSFWTVASSRPLAAPSDDKNTSCCEKPTPVPRFVNPAVCCGSASNSDCDETNLLRYYGCSDRKRHSDESGSVTDCQMSKRERGNATESWKFHVVASSRCKTASLVASDVIRTIDFDQTGNLFATGGIAKKIRISSYLQMIGESQVDNGSSDQSTDLSEDDDVVESSRRKKQSGPPVRDHEFGVIREICTPGKLSSLKWAPGGSDVIGCGDYDGVVSEWSVEHGHTVSERYEHNGMRVWSLDYSKSTPALSASSSDDGTVRVWMRGTDKSVLVIRPKSGASLCSAEFNPVGDHLIAVASADANVYLYDLRMTNSPLLRLKDHTRPVSYVRFLGKDTLVSASIDSTLKLWDISAPVRAVEDGRSLLSGKPGLLPDSGGAHIVRTFSSHSNFKHFVGVSVHGGSSIIACGSETNAVFVYRGSSRVPILKHEFPGASSVYSGLTGSGNPYVGAVCWREQRDPYSLVAANSDGVVHVLQASRKTL